MDRPSASFRDLCTQSSIDQAPRPLSTTSRPKKLNVVRRGLSNSNSLALFNSGESIQHTFFEDRLPSSTLRESTPLSADTDDPVVRPPDNALVKPVVLPAALTNAPARCPRHCPHSSWPPMPILKCIPTTSTRHKGTPYSRLTIPLPGYHMSCPTMRTVSFLVTQRGSLKKIPKNASSLVARYYHICATMSRSCLITL